MGFDQTFRRDGEARGRALGQYMRHVAERVFTHVKTAIGGNVDLPFGDILPVMTAGRHSQNLDETGCRRFVAIGGGVGNSQAHDEEFRVVAQCRAAAEVRSLSLWERVGVRGYGLSLGLTPSPGSQERSDLSPRERLDRASGYVRFHIKLPAITPDTVSR